MSMLRSGTWRVKSGEGEGDGVSRRGGEREKHVRGWWRGRLTECRPCSTAVTGNGVTVVIVTDKGFNCNTSFCSINA